ncbi:hypothetical protein [Geomonas agri]|uniref:hypothetical protein n=1 Tax=Geomonas agri TaxID=2873702 RepID=UPI001CD74507|nr:hypothetical protein [Geomonas agri]
MSKFVMVKNLAELDDLGLRNFYHVTDLLSNDGFPTATLYNALGKLLVGKPVIAGFLGISEKTLKRYLNQDHKLNTIPIVREPHRCLSTTNILLLWLIELELNKIDETLVEKARCIVTAQHLRVSLEHFMEHYIYGSQYRIEPNNNRLRTRKYYKKTVDRVVSLVRLKSIIALTIEK